MDKDSSHNSARCLAWWRAVRHVAFPIVLAMSTHKRAYCEPCSVFALLPRNPLLKRHCGGDNKLVCCQRPHLFSQQLTAQSLVCSQNKHRKELLSQFRTIDCLVRRAAPRKTDNISVAISLPFGTLLCNRRSYICFRQAISRSLAVPYSAFSQGSFKSIICAHIHIHTRTHGLFYTRIINP